jgi:hypothetical protein
MNRILPLLFACAPLFACADDGTNDDTAAADPDAADAGATDTGVIDAGVDDGDSTADEAPRVGFEILQILSPNEIIVWVNAELTQEEFDAIELPPGWFKNQPREVDMDGGSFARSPDASADGEFTEQEHFGHLWLHNATVIEANTPLDDQGLLRLNRVAKFHQITFNAGRTLWILVSPEGERFVRVSRDAGRTSEQPTIPDGWQLLEHETQEELTIELPNPTLNVRANNEDSFQGPVAELDVGS